MISPEAVAKLIRSGADVTANDWRGETPLHSAVGSFYVQEEVFRLLVSVGADEYAKDNNGKTQLDLWQQNQL